MYTLCVGGLLGARPPDQRQGGNQAKHSRGPQRKEGAIEIRLDGHQKNDTKRQGKTNLQGDPQARVLNQAHCRRRQGSRFGRQGAVDGAQARSDQEQDQHDDEQERAKGDDKPGGVTPPRPHEVDTGAYQHNHRRHAHPIRATCPASPTRNSHLSRSSVIYYRFGALVHFCGKVALSHQSKL